MIRKIITRLFLITAVITSAAQAQQHELFTLGSGDVTGGYFSAARAICDNINHAERGKIRCSPDPSSGSLYNLSMLKKGELDLALVQSDWQVQAYTGTGRFSGYLAMPGLRTVMGLYPETITLIVSAESGITRPADLIGKHIDMGPPSSSRFASVSRLFDLLKIKPTDFKSVLGFTPDRAIDELCGGNVDAIVFIVGHPNANVARAMSECGAQMISLDGPVIEASLGTAKEYLKIQIPATTYPGLNTNVDSYAVYSTIVTRADIDAELINTFVTRILENLNGLAKASEVLVGLTMDGMRDNGLTAPLHPGAERAYKAFEQRQLPVGRD